jgi:hypothetical protein
LKGPSMRTLRLACWFFVCSVILAACTSIPVERMDVSSSMITSGGSTSHWEEVPLTRVQLKDMVYMLTYVRWSPATEGAGHHKVHWDWYNGTRLVYHCEQGYEFKQSPVRLWCRTPAAGLGLGHYRAVMSVDGRDLASHEFDIIEVKEDPTPTHVDYVPPGGQPAAGSLVAHCPNAIDVAREVGFPSEAIGAGLKEGSVTMSLLLAPDGGMRSIHVVESTDKVFNRSAIDAVTRLRCSGAGLQQETELRWNVKYQAR